jgi:ABC-type uncharacterized transport system substrate-binding protein
MLPKFPDLGGRGSNDEAPAISIGILWTYVPPIYQRSGTEPALVELRNAARLFGLELYFAEAAGPDEVPGALTQIERERPDALLLTSGNLAVEVRPTIMQFAMKHRLPTITDGIWVINIVPIIS